MILFIGPPGCGKGTQSLLLKQRDFFEIFSFGDQLRAMSEKDDSFGSVVKEAINFGKILDPEILFKKIDISIFEIKKVILDGFPRSINQALFFDSFLKKIKKNIDYIFEFDVPEDVLIERIRNRKICIKCQQSFFMKCKCRVAKYVKREDDQLSVFKTRLKNYREQQKDLLNFYSNHNYYHLNALGNVEEVYERIKKILKSL